MSTPPRRAWPFVLLAVFVCAAAGIVGGSFGVMATFAYETRDKDGHRVEYAGKTPGAFLGGGSGLLTAALWCFLMVRRAARGPETKVIGRGTLLGIAAGVLSTIALHAVLMMESRHWAFDTLFLCLIIFGIPAGAVVGVVSAGACRLAQRLTFAPDRPPEVPAA